MKKTGFKVNKTPLKPGEGFKRSNSSIPGKKPLKRAKWAKKQPLSLQAECDRLFSLVRRMSAADSRGMVNCVTCGKSQHWKEMQLGHFIPRGYLATRYSLFNTDIQCEDCNCFKDGMSNQFEIHLVRKYGQPFVDAMKISSQQIIHNFPYVEYIAEFNKTLEMLVTLQDNEIQY